jgi:membrane associated rhomboid family serine protease
MSPTTYSIKHSVTYTVLFIAALWMIKSAEILFSIDLVTYGVLPGEFSGLVGILTAPLIHGSISHISNNSLSLLILGSAILYGYPNTRWKVISIIWIASGIGVWLFARPVHHIGASGLTHGIFFYIFIVSILRRDKRSIVLMMIAFFMYGGMVMTIFPRELGISYESHFFGALVGAVCAFMFFRSDPKLAEKTFDWQESEEIEDSVIGDDWKLTDDKNEPIENNESADEDNKPLH